MKTEFRIRHWLSLVLLVGLILAGQATSQTFKNLHSFNATDGANPWAGLVLSSNTLYGTTVSGGGLDMGTVFALSSDGTGLRTVHKFTDWQWPIYTNFDGAHPVGGLILAGNTLYGTAQYGGSSADGTLFAVKTDGTGFTVLHHFTTNSANAFGVYTNGDGVNPVAALILAGDTLYGTALYGGSSGNGTLFAFKTDGTGFTVLHAFTTANTNSFGVYTNSDGASPYGGLVLSSNTLYGTAISGGSYGNGTIFYVHTDGTEFTTLHNFSNIDGAGPVAALIVSANRLYGTTPVGGSYGNGTIFSVRTNGTEFIMLHSFTTYSDSSITNNDGANPHSALIFSGDTLYGTAQVGGSSGYGTVFAMNIDGTGFRTLHNFAAPPIGFPHTNTDGYYPSGDLVLSSNVLYGTARYGGSYSGNNDPDCNGTIFSISLPVSPPQLKVIASGENLILRWPTNNAGFDYSGYILQSTSNVISPAWTTNLPGPVVVNGEYTVTTSISGTQQFFRLSQLP